MKKKIFFALMLLGLAVPGYAVCTDSTGTAEQKVKNYLNYNTRTASGSKAYNNITTYYSNATGGACDLSTIANKLENIQNLLNSNISSNFNGTSQIPYNDRNPYTGKEAELELPDGTKRKMNTPVDGTDHMGLIKYTYAKAGVNTVGLNEMEIDDFAKLTQYQLQQNSPLKPGDVIVMNYGNDASIDTVGLVYWDTNAGRLKMLEMGGNAQNPGTSVKSEIPVTSTNSTAYVVPFETVMEAAYSTTDPSTERRNEIKDNMLTSGSPMNIPASNPTISEYSQPRPGGPLVNNGFTDSQTVLNDLDGKSFAKQMTGMTRTLFEIFSKGTAKVAPVILMLMTITFSLQILWKIFRGGAFGSPDQIFNMVLSEVMLKSPYFAFVVFYPLLMRYLIIPIFMFQIPTYIFGDFIKVGGISMENGRYVTYLDIMAHIMKKGLKLIIATFGAGMTQQPASIKSLFEMFGTIWKTLNPASHIANIASGDWVAVAGGLLNVYGTLTKIVYMILQLILFRPISVLTGLMTVVTLFNLALNMFMCCLSFILSTSVGLFYMICGTWDILRAKALNTFSIIISGLIQYMVMFGFIIVMAEVTELLGNKLMGTILNPTNFVFLIKIYLCISIANAMCKQLGTQLAAAF